MAIVDSSIAVKLRIYDMVELEHASFSQNVTGTKTARRKDDHVDLKRGRNENVPDEFWAAWKKQNEGSAFLTSGALVEVSAGTPAKQEVK